MCESQSEQYVSVCVRVCLRGQVCVSYLSVSKDKNVKTNKLAGVGGRGYKGQGTQTRSKQ